MPGAEILPGRKRYELIDDVRQVPGKQLRFQDGKELAGINGPLTPQHRASCVKRLPGRAPASDDKHPQCLESDGLRCIRSKLEEAIDKDWAEQFGRASCRIEDLTGRPCILSPYRFAPGMGMIDTV